MKTTQLLAVAAIAVTALAARAAEPPAAPEKPAASTAQPMTGGEVRKLDASQGKVTLRHERIANLDMPPMTMVFRVAKPDLLAGLNVGDKVLFRAEDVAGTLTVTEIRK